jgi:putative salt-induced outer membrane protein
MPLFPQSVRWLFCLGAALMAAGAVPALAADSAPVLGWEGQVALGGSLATGNTDRQALDLETKIQHRTPRREDRFRALGDLARENGDITAERVQMAAQSNYDISKDKFYVLAFTQYNRDKFSGFDYEVELGPGLGYRFVRTERITFSMEFSTGYRHGELPGPGTDGQIFARGTITGEYQLSDHAKLENEMLITGDEQRLKVENTFSVTSTLIRDIAARLSINARYNTDPPLVVKKVDTVSKVSLVYAF